MVAVLQSYRLTLGKGVLVRFVLRRIADTDQIAQPIAADQTVSPLLDMSINDWSHKYTKAT